MTGLAEAGSGPLPEIGDIDVPAELVHGVRDHVRSRSRELIAFRRRVHAEPELSYAEVATTDAVIERLLVEDLHPVRLASGTGLVCDIGPGEPVVALRADIDALPVHETTDLPFRSRVPGVAHACGHDVHTAAVLGAGLALHQLHGDSQLRRGVRLIFEPGEEQVPGGALEIIEGGWLQGIEQIYAVHCEPKLDVGLAGVRVGPITSASDLVEVTLTGPGGHTARPNLTVNLVDVAARLAVELPHLVAQHVAQEGPARLVFGALQAGEAANVIPDLAVVRGSLRTPVQSAWDLMPEALDAGLHQILDGTGAEWTLRHVRGVAPVENDAAAAAVLGSASQALLGEGSVVPAEQSWGGDSFGWFTRAVPGAYLRLGTHNPAWTDMRDLHHPAFEVDERAIPHGAAILALAALSAMG